MLRQHLILPRFLVDVLAHFLVIAATLLAAPAVSLAQSASAEVAQDQSGQAQAGRDRADELFLQGKAAAQAKKWNEAHQLLAEAWQLKQSYDIASNLGQVAYLLGKHAEAAQHVSFALRHYPATGDSEQKQKAQSLFDMVRQKVSSLSLQVTPSDAEVLVDGEPAGRASSLPPELFVEPGERIISAELGGERVQREVNAKPGGHYRLELTLAGVDAAAAAAAPGAIAEPAQPANSSFPPPDSAPPSKSGLQPKHIALIVGGALTLASGVVLGVYAAKRSKAESDLDTYRARVQEESGDPTACATSNSQACRDLANATDDWESAGRARNIFLATTIVLGAGTVATFLLWPSDDSSSGPSASLTPVLDPGQPGLVLSGSF